VTTIERYATLAEEAQVRLEIAGADPGIEMGVGNGLKLDLGAERFDRILVNGAVPAVPSALTSLLAVGGRLVGGLAVDGFPRLIKVERGEDGSLAQTLGAPLRLARLTCGRGALQAAA
jgi:protein-L-isoaspartate(D-aspartate) O-methyltransferase